MLLNWESKILGLFPRVVAGVGPPRVRVNPRPGSGVLGYGDADRRRRRVLSDLATLRDQAELFGPVASAPTLWRTLAPIGDGARGEVARARAKTREHVWSLIETRHVAIPPSRVAAGDLGKTIVIRMDASIVIAHLHQGAGGGHVGSQPWPRAPLSRLSG